MSDHIRMLPEKYAVICLACHSLHLCGDPDALRRRIVLAVSNFDPALGGALARMSARQLLCLRKHLEQMREAVERPGSREQPAADLSFSEWRVVARAAALVSLRAGDAGPVKEHLVREVGEEEPALAAKLCRLDEARFDGLLRRVQSGSRRYV